MIVPPGFQVIAYPHKAQLRVMESVLCFPSFALIFPVGNKPDQHLVPPSSNLLRDIGATEDGHYFFVSAGTVEEIELIDFGLGIELCKFNVYHLPLCGGDQPFTIAPR